VSIKAVPCQYEPWPELVSKLESLLEEAKRGDLRSFGYACERRNGDCGQYAFHDVGSNAFKLVGIIEALKASVVRRYL
jgi:hypothetical protein